MRTQKRRIIIIFFVFENCSSYLHNELSNVKLAFFNQSQRHIYILWMQG